MKYFYYRSTVGAEIFYAIKWDTDYDDGKSYSKLFPANSKTCLLALAQKIMYEKVFMMLQLMRK